MPDKQIVMYVRSEFICPYVKIAERVLRKHELPYREVDIDTDNEARQRVRAWTGFLSVPTILISDGDSVVPYDMPAALPEGASPRGVDRGTMISEPSGRQLEQWLEKHGLLPEKSLLNTDQK
ncbi:MAG: glutaredoxin family protein [Chloroflexi bacterium]|nr:glutaredoxin family protein [Chloroflexota bacterium]